MRLFNSHQRLAMYAAEGGRCALCGRPLLPGFHADHITPAVQGGATDVLNGQALCPRCNALKGATQGAPPIPAAQLPLPLPPWTKALRRWQERGFVQWRRLRAEGRKDVLATATPGSGKSLLAVRILHDELSSGKADHVVIVAPSQILKRQWAAVAQAHGLRLAAAWGNDAVVLPPDVHGVIVTYAQVGRLPEALRVQCSRHKVLVVCDEIHHAADGLAWGNGIREAFEHAQARLCLSGTAWRGDAATIPFVTYNAQGQSVADIAYDYAAALGDGVVREAYFFTQGGQVKWLDGQGEHEFTFEDALSPVQRAKRLRAALDVDGAWLPAIMGQAVGALEAVRQTHPRAKGLIVCMDASHARAVAAMAARVTGETPVLALSDDPDAGEALMSFREGTARWLVVCRMAGEGYDCADLRVCLWATNLLTELFFRQVVGRVIRMAPGLEYQDGQVFLPSDPRLLAMAQSILSERVRALGGPQEERDARAPEAGGGHERALFVPLESRPAAGVVVTGGATIPTEALEKAQAFKSGKPALAHLPAHFIAAIFSQMEPHQWPEAAPAMQEMAERAAADEPAMGAEAIESYDALRLQKRRLCSRLAAMVARAAGEAIETVHRACHQELGVKQGEASLADLERKEQMLLKRLRHFPGL